MEYREKKPTNTSKEWTPRKLRVTDTSLKYQKTAKEMKTRTTNSKKHYVIGI